MALLNTAKRQRTTEAHTTSREGQNTRRQFVEELEEDTLTDDSVDVDEEAEDEEIGSSQGTVVQNMILGGISNQKKRHVVNKKQVKEKYIRAKTELQGDINALFEEHEEQADTAHSAQLKRLAELIALKASLDSKMNAKLAHLQKMYDAHSRELSNVIDSRIKELRK